MTDPEKTNDKGDQGSALADLFDLFMCGVLVAVRAEFFDF